MGWLIIKKIRAKPFETLLILTLIALFSVAILNKVNYYRIVKALRALEPRHITAFRIYPRVNRPVGIPIEFTSSEPIVVEFFEAIVDMRLYWLSPGTLASRDHAWFVEIVAEGKQIQMSSSILSGRDDAVYGTLGKFVKGGGGPLYGDFQSRKLFQWYQKYSHLWLEPDKSDQP